MSEYYVACSRCRETHAQSFVCGKCAKPAKSLSDFSSFLAGKEAGRKEREAEIVRWLITHASGPLTSVSSARLLCEAIERGAGTAKPTEGSGTLEREGKADG